MNLLIVVYFYWLLQVPGHRIILEEFSIDVKMGYVAGDLLGIEPGNAEMGAGVGGEVVGVGADATGVGAVAGIPLNIISAGSYCAWSYCCCYLWK
jgi:hypothetical protein